MRNLEVRGQFLEAEAHSCLEKGEGGYVWASWRWHQFNLGDIKALMLGNLEYMKAAGGAGKPGSPGGNQKSFLMF